jgi:hypothetical protein
MTQIRESCFFVVKKYGRWYLGMEKAKEKIIIQERSIPVRRIFGDLNKKEPSWYDTGCQIVCRNDP